MSESKPLTLTGNAVLNVATLVLDYCSLMVRHERDLMDDKCSVDLLNYATLSGQRHDKNEKTSDCHD
jgi:hypothetical protein